MLNEDQLLEIENICKTWLISNNKIDRKLEDIYCALKEVDFTSAIQSFTKRLEKIPYQFTKSEQVSGSICYFGGIFTSLLNTGKVEEIENLFTFALCYMLIDHFLDDNTISDEEKKKSMQEVYEFLLYGKETNNPLIQAGKKRYQKMIKNNLKIQSQIIKLFRSEIKGAAISQNKNLSRKEYLEIAKEKGGGTSLAIATVIGLEDYNSHYNVGSCIQFVDDLIDIKDDEKLGIYTLARHDYEKTNLDYYIYETMIEISKLEPIYNFFKVILLSGCVLGIHDNPKSVTPQLFKIIQKYNPFSKNTSKDTLTEWFHNKLYGYIEEKMNV